MIFFCVRRWFYALWDNLLAVFLLNLSALVLLLAPASYLLLGPGLDPGLALAGLAACFLPLGPYAAAAHALAGVMERGEVPRPAALRGGARRIVADGLVLLAANAVVALATGFAVAWYSGREGTLPLAGYGIGTAALALWFLAGQWFPAERGIAGTSLPGAIKESFSFALENPGFTLGAAAGSALIISASAATILLFPGYAGLALWQRECHGLRAKKYAWLEANPERAGSPLPWREVLAEEIEALKGRTLRGLIFPWKEK